MSAFPVLLLTPDAAARAERAGCDLVDICRVLSDARRRVRFPECKREAVRRCVRDMRSNRAISAIVVIVMCADDSIDLIRVGPRGGVSRITRLLDRNHRPI